MADFLQYLRQQNIFGPRSPLFGNDLPSQGGIGGNLPPGPNFMPRSIGGDIPIGGMPMGVENMPPPQFQIPENFTKPSPQDPFDINFGRGPLEINQGDMAAARMPVAGQGMPEMDAGARMRELYQPTNDATQRFERMIDEYPQRENPSWLRRIASMIVDYTKGPAAGRALYEEPQREAEAEWKAKIGPAQQAANLERYENANERTLAYQQMSLELNERKQKAIEENNERKAAILQQRADIYAFKATHPNFKFVMPKGGNVMAGDPATGQMHDTGVPTGSLTDLDKLHIGQEQALERIGAQGEQARETETVRQAGRETLVGMRGEQARQTKATPPGGITGKGLMPTQIKVDQYTKARQIVNSNPELAPFIKLGPSNEFEVVRPNPGGWTERGRGPTPQQYSDIINTIYGQSMGGRGGGPGPGPASSPTAAPNTSGTIRVQLSDGTTRRFKGTPEEAKAAGYTVIGQ